MSALLRIDGLGVAFGAVQPLTGVRLAVGRGEIHGLVGESGSGKSLTATAVMGLLPLIGGRVVAGSIRFDGAELIGAPPAAHAALRGDRIALITQNPMTALDPLHRIGPQVDAVSRRHLGMDAAAARARTVDLLAHLRIPEPATVCGLYPHQLSGGMKQRVVIAIALAGEPELIVADEPTTALDVTVQAQIMRLLVEAAQARSLGLLLITHDMSVIAQTCDRVTVMYAGQSIETGPADAIFAAPRHPYTAALIGCIPRADLASGGLSAIEGMVPTPAAYPEGCRFHPRCGRAEPLCIANAPAFHNTGAQAGAACHFAVAAS